MDTDKHRMRTKARDLGDPEAAICRKTRTGRGTPAANAANSRRTGPSNASTP
jgi:hypothetical protein